MIKLQRFVILLLVFLAAVFLLLPHARLAFTIGTGVGLESTLQKQIEETQSRAIKQITPDDKEFLVRFYRTMAYGAPIDVYLARSARLMHHYLDGSGASTSINKSLYTESPRVIDRMNSIKKYLKSNCKVGATKTSARFDMGHGYPLDAHFFSIFWNHQGDDR